MNYAMKAVIEEGLSIPSDIHAWHFLRYSPAARPLLLGTHIIAIHLAAQEVVLPPNTPYPTI